MGLSVKVNQLTGPGATGSAATTDPGFQPAGILLWNPLATATGATAGANFNIGFGTASTARNHMGYSSTDAAATSAAGRSLSTVHVLRAATSGTSTANLSADLTSLDATGFTLNWGTLTTTSPLFNYLALGGSDITNMKAGSFASGTTTGNVSATGVGFQPDIVFLCISLATANGMAVNNNNYSIGVMTSSAQWAMGVKTQNAQATMNTSRSFRNDRCLVVVSSITDTLAGEFSYVSMDADGFTINQSVAAGTNSVITYLAIKGGQWKVGTDTQKTSTGTKGTTGVGFTPSAVILGSVCDTSTAATAANSRLSFGVSDGTRNVATWTGDSDAVPDSISNTIQSNTKCIVLATEGTSATPTTNAEASMSSLDSDGFTLNWTTADATARVFGYVAVGANAVAPAATAHNLTLLGVGS